MKNKTITVRVDNDLYKKCVIYALEKGVKDEKIYTISDVIRLSLKEITKNG